MDVGSFPKRREREGMGSRRVSESLSGSIIMRIKKLIQKNSSRYNKGKYFMK